MMKKERIFAFFYPQMLLRAQHEPCIISATPPVVFKMISGYLLFFIIHHSAFIIVYKYRLISSTKVSGLMGFSM